MADNLVAEVLCVFLFEAETVVFRIFVPLSELDDKVDALSLFYARYTEQSLNVHDTDTTKFDEVLGGLGCGSDKCVFADFSDFYYVIGYETMASLDKLESCLGFTDTGLTDNQYAFAVNID